MLFDYLFYYNYLLNTPSPKTSIDIFIFFIDQLIPECTEEFLLTYFNSDLVSKFLEQVNERRYELRKEQTQPSKKNNFQVELQIFTEDLFKEYILPVLHESPVILRNYIDAVYAKLYVKTKDIKNCNVLSNIVFEYFLKQLNNPNFNISKENVYVISNFFKFKRNKNNLLAVFKEYKIEDVLQTLNYITTPSGLSIKKKTNILLSYALKPRLVIGKLLDIINKFFNSKISRMWVIWVIVAIFTVISVLSQH